jgi:hypothetical protein
VNPFPLLVAIMSAAATFPPRPEAPAPQPSVDNAYWMADCLLEHRLYTDNVLSSAPGNSEAVFALFQAAIGPCLVAERPLPGPAFFLRGAIAERLLYRDFASIGAEPRHRAVPVFASVRRDDLRSANENVRRLLAMLELASCVARAEPAKVYAFFATERGSPAEHASMAALAPAISACLVEGQTFEMSPPVFRAFLAEGAYRVAAGQPSVYETSP